MYKPYVLKYDYNTLSPDISRKTVEAHYHNHYLKYLRNLNNLLAQNNFKPVIHFPNAYEISINENSKLVVHNTNEPPDISNASGFGWTKAGSNDWVLNCNDFYLVKMTGNTIHVLQLR